MRRSFDDCNIYFVEYSNYITEFSFLQVDIFARVLEIERKKYSDVKHGYEEKFYRLRNRSFYIFTPFSIVQEILLKPVAVRNLVVHRTDTVRVCNKAAQNNILFRSLSSIQMVIISRQPTSSSIHEIRSNSDYITKL